MVLPFGVIAMNCRPPGSKIFLLRNFVEFGIAYRLPSPLSTHVVVGPVALAGRAAGGGAAPARAGPLSPPRPPPLDPRARGVARRRAEGRLARRSAVQQVAQP